MKKHSLVGCVVIALAFFPAIGHALALDEALERAVSHNPELAAFEHRLREQEGRVAQAALLPNPELNVEVEDFAGTDSLSGFDRAQTTLSLGWVLERAIRRKRIAAAEARSSLLLFEAAILRLEVAGETAERFITNLEEQEHLEKASEAVAYAEEAVGAVRRRVRAGRTPGAGTRARGGRAREGSAGSG